MALPSIHAVDEKSLPEFCHFLHQHLDSERSVQEWQECLSYTWSVDRPNYGFILRDETNNIVGGIGAYYADQVINGNQEKFCNITSWCVLDNYRAQSMRLAMTLVSQKGYHYTDFSPTKVVGDVLQFLKFKPLDERVTVLFNLPWVSAGHGIVSGKGIIEHLNGSNTLVYQDHAAFPWLHHIVAGRGERQCYVIYKTSRFKGMTSVHILYASDGKQFAAHYRAFASWWLLHHAAVTTHYETRSLVREFWPSKIRTGFVNKVFLSDTLEESDISYIYSESVALDIL